MAGKEMIVIIDGIGMTQEQDYEGRFVYLYICLVVFNATSKNISVISSIVKHFNITSIYMYIFLCKM